MSNRLLLVAPATEPRELFHALERLQLEAVVLLREGAADPFGHLEVLRTPAISPDSMVKTARDCGVRGIWTDNPAHCTDAATAARRLGLAHQESASRSQAFAELAAVLQRENGPVARVQTVGSATAAQEAFRVLGGPVLVRASGAWGTGRCQWVEHEADVPLAIDSLAKHFPQGSLLLQKFAEGPAFRLPGFKWHRDFYPLDLLQENIAAGTSRVTMSAALPSGLNGDQFTQAVNVARQAAHALPQGQGYVEIEMVCTEQGPVVTNVLLPPRPHPVLNRIFELGLGINVLAECFRVALGALPHTSASRDLAVAACWLPGRSGVVVDVQHTREALALEGVQQLHIEAQPGQTLGHVVDAASRDRVGFVIAVRPTRAQALRSAEAARDCVELITNPML